MTARDRLDRHLAGIADTLEASTGDCVHIITLARELVESGGERRRFPTLAFYADWLLHPALDRAGARELLSSVQALFDRDAIGEKVDLVREVSGIMALDKLRSELRSLLLRHRLPTFMVDSKGNWDGLVGKVLTDLMSKPIIGSDFTEEEIRTGWGTAARKLYLSAERLGDGAPILWHVQTSPRMQITGQLVGREPREAFQLD